MQPLPHCPPEKRVRLRFDWPAPGFVREYGLQRQESYPNWRDLGKRGDAVAVFFSKAAEINAKLKMKNAKLMQRTTFKLKWFQPPFCIFHF